MKFADMDQTRKKQVIKQLQDFKNMFQDIDETTVDICLTPEFILKNYILHKDVFQSNKMVSVEFARWLIYNNGEYKGKNVIDMCCGGGIQGIVALLNNAKHVTFVDSSKNACENTKANLAQYSFQDKAQVIQSDLFTNVQEKADLIIVNPPFFPAAPLKNEPISKTMCFEEEKSKQLYRDAKKYAKKMAVCYWDFAGTKNDPEILGPKLGWNIERKLTLPTGYGIQKALDTKKKYYFKVILLKAKN